MIARTREWRLYGYVKSSEYSRFSLKRSLAQRSDRTRRRTARYFEDRSPLTNTSRPPRATGLAGSSQSEGAETPASAGQQHGGPYTTPPDEFGRYKKYQNTPAFISVPPELRTRLPVFPLAASVDPPSATPGSEINEEPDAETPEGLAKRLLLPLPNVTQLMQALHHYSTSGNSNAQHDRFVDIMHRPDFNKDDTVYISKV